MDQSMNRPEIPKCPEMHYGTLVPQSQPPLKGGLDLGRTFLGPCPVPKWDGRFHP
jgi:hypothetical protein